MLPAGRHGTHQIGAQARNGGTWRQADRTGIKQAHVEGLLRLVLLIPLLGGLGFAETPIERSREQSVLGGGTGAGGGGAAGTAGTQHRLAVDGVRLGGGGGGGTGTGHATGSGPRSAHRKGHGAAASCLEDGIEQLIGIGTGRQIRLKAMISRIIVGGGGLRLGSF